MDIGLTILAFGTSLAELAASVIAVRKGEPNIAIGNVIETCMFNLLAVVGIAGVIAYSFRTPGRESRSGIRRTNRSSF